MSYTSLSSPVVGQNRLLIYTEDLDFVQEIRRVVEIGQATSTGALLKMGLSAQWSRAPILVDLALQVERRQCDQCVFTTLERLRCQDPQRLILGLNSGQDTHLVHKSVFYFVLDKAETLKDIRSIVQLIFTQQSIKRAESQTSMMLNRVGPSSDTEPLPEIDQLRLSRIKWKTAQAKSLEECRRMAVEVLGGAPDGIDESVQALPEFWARTAIINLQAENSRLRAKMHSYGILDQEVKAPNW